MILNDDEFKYSKVIDSLKQLPRVKVPENFALELMRKINSEKYAEKKINFLERFFIPGRLIPSAGLAVAAVILFFVINTNSDEFENPLLIKPRLREEASVSSPSVLQPPAVELKKNLINEEIKAKVTRKDEVKKEYFASDLKDQESKGTYKAPVPKISAPEPLGFTRLDSVNSLENRIWSDNDSFLSQNAEISVDYPVMRSSSGEVYQITKSGLNFRQVNIVEEERQQINQLKEKIKLLMNRTGKALKIK